MKNKLSIIFFLIASNLFIFNTYSYAQINFDVTEIEILDGGDKIIGKNRGTITTNNGIIIKANKFEFDKIKNRLQPVVDLWQRIIETGFQNGLKIR